MKTFTTSEARRQLASLLDLASREGRVQIRRRNGQIFVVQPVTEGRSPLDVPGVRVPLRRGDVAEWIRESGNESAERLVSRRASNKKAGARRKPTSRRRRGTS